MAKLAETNIQRSVNIANDYILVPVIYGCEMLKCHYYIDGKCTDPIDWKNENYESVCGYRDDAIHPDDLP